MIDHRTMTHRARTALAALTTVAFAAAAVVACSGSDPQPIAAGTPDASVSPTPTTPPSPEPDPDETEDAATGDSAVEGDGGANIDLGDGGDPDFDPDAGDAGDSGAPAACNMLTPGATRTSTCAAFLLVLGGGAITSGDFELTSVATEGSLLFCGKGGTFSPTDHGGSLKVSILAKGTWTLDLYLNAKASGVLGRPTVARRSYTMSIDALDKTKIDTSQSCPVGGGLNEWGYATGTDKGGNATITLRLPNTFFSSTPSKPTGFVRYTFTKK